MQVFHSTKDVQNYLNSKGKNSTVGFVPTMGALHEGHLSLIQKAISQNDITIVSIFVNPTQFDNAKDLEKYPRTLEADVKLLETVNCDAVFAPTVEDIYSKNVTSKRFYFDGLEHQMEGEHRQGHFDGVGTIVKRLFEIVKPNNAYFGEKDFQQLQIIKKLVEKHTIPVKVIGCPIHREKDGLAMSSRNTRLTKKHREASPFIYQVLQQAKADFNSKSITKITEWAEQAFKNNPDLKLEYFTIANTKNLKTAKRKLKNNTYRAFIACYAGEIRLIDNIALN